MGSTEEEVNFNKSGNKRGALRNWDISMVNLFADPANFFDCIKWQGEQAIGDSFGFVLGTAHP